MYICYTCQTETNDNADCQDAYSGLHFCSYITKQVLMIWPKIKSILLLDKHSPR